MTAPLVLSRSCRCGGVEYVQHLSIRERMLRAGYMLAPSPLYACKRVLRDGLELGHFSSKSVVMLFLGSFKRQGRYGAVLTAEQEAEHDRQDAAEESAFYAAWPASYAEISNRIARLGRPS